MTPKELKAAGWKRRRENDETIWTRGDMEIVTRSPYAQTWDFRLIQAGVPVVADSTWGVTLTDYLDRLGRKIAVRTVDGAATFQKLSRYEEFPKGATSFREWALTPA